MHFEAHMLYSRIEATDRFPMVLTAPETQNIKATGSCRAFRKNMQKSPGSKKRVFFAIRGLLLTNF